MQYGPAYFAFGKSVFDKTSDGLAISFIDETYQLIEDGYSFIMKSNEKKSLFNFVTDSTLKNDLSGIDTVRERTMETKLKSFTQNFNHALIHNEMK